MARWYSVEQMLDILNNNETHKHDDAIKKQAAIMRLYIEKLRVRYNADIKLNISENNTYIQSRARENAGYGTDPTLIVMRKLNLVTQTKVEDTYRSLRKINPNDVLQCFVKKATSPMDDPQKLSSGILYVVQVYNMIKHTDEVYSTFPDELIKIYNENISLTIRNKCKTMVCFIAHLFASGSLSRQQFGEALTKLIKEFPPDDAVEHLVAAFLVAGKYIDEQEYMEFSFFYRYMNNNYKNCKSFIQFLMDELLRLRGDGWMTEEEKLLAAQQQLLKNRSKQSGPTYMNTSQRVYANYQEQHFLECDEAIQHEFQQYLDSGVFMDINDFKPIVIIETGFKLLEKYQSQIDDYTYFLAYAIRRLYKNIDQMLIAIQRKMHVINDLVDEEGNTGNMWTNFGRLLDVWMNMEDGISLEQAFNLLSDVSVPENQSYKIKCILADDDEEVAKYESNKIFAEKPVPTPDELNIVYVKIAIYSEAPPDNALNQEAFIKLADNFVLSYVFKYVRAVINACIMNRKLLHEHIYRLTRIKNYFKNLFMECAEQSIRIAPGTSRMREEFKIFFFEEVIGDMK